jgi:hypothetical protein
MLEIVFIYFVGKKFYALAEMHNKSKWGFAVLGVVSFYATTFLAGVGIGLLGYNGMIDEMSPLVLSLMAIPVGLLGCWGFYSLLKRAWTKDAPADAGTLDSDMIG